MGMLFTPCHRSEFRTEMNKFVWIATQIYTNTHLKKTIMLMFNDHDLYKANRFENIKRTCVQLVKH